MLAGQLQSKNLEVYKIWEISEFKEIVPVAQEEFYLFVNLTCKV